MKLLFLVALLLTLEGCQDTGRFEAIQIEPFAASTTVVWRRETRAMNRRPFAATQRYVWSWATSRHCADIANRSLVTQTRL